MVLMRNPYGYETYKQKYSDYWSGWTQDLRDKLATCCVHCNIEADMGDGLFWMDLDAFVKNFSDTNVNQDTTGWKHDYFLQIDDETNGDHYITVTNTGGAAAEVYVGAHTWAFRHYTLRGA